MDRSDAAYRFVQEANRKEAESCAKSGQLTFRSELVFAVSSLFLTALWLDGGSTYFAVGWGGIAAIQFWRAYRLWREGKDA